MTRALFAAAALALAAGPAAAQPAGDPPGTRYYFLLFGAQTVPFVPSSSRSAHTWATWVKAVPTADGSVSLETVTISWLAADERTRPWQLRSEVGRNFTLDETFRVMRQTNSAVSMWGPFEVDGTRYCLAQQQAARLESGAVRYRTLDSLGNNQSVVHCVHAVTDADPVVKRYRQPVIRVGEPGTSHLAELYLKDGALIGGATTHDWVIPAIGLDRYCFTRRCPGERIPRQWR
jgi:hypothetical protein